MKVSVKRELTVVILAEVTILEIRMLFTSSGNIILHNTLNLLFLSIYLSPEKLH